MGSIIRRIIVSAIILLISAASHAQNVGIGTTNPQTKLQVAGALGLEPSDEPADDRVVINDNVSIFRLRLTTGGNTTDLSVNSPKEGQLLTIYNEDDNDATFAGITILAYGGIAHFNYINAGWRLISTNPITGPTGDNGTDGVTGPTGAVGSNGSNGATGPTGAAGSNGTNGTNGNNGADGATGPTGAAGSNGTNGVTGPTGAVGAAGSNGTNGVTGPTGAAGSNGTNGTNGNNGVDGATGPTGAAGSNGSNGVTGPTGAVGAAGSNGSNGITGPTGANGNNGINGTDGSNGTNGTNGTNGSTWMTGTVAPTGGQGNVNDLYLNTVTSIYYLKTGTSTWTQEANLTGATGATGPTGPLLAGTTGQTLYNNGTTWTATSNLYNDGTNVSIGTATTANARLEVGGNNQTIRVDGLTGTGANQFATAGTQILYTDNNGDLTVTKPTSTPSNDINWSIFGNGGTTAGTNFIGTTGNTDLVFKTNNTEEMRITAAGGLTFAGGAAGTNGQLLVGNTGSAPGWATASGDATITNTGVITLKNTGTASTYGSSTQVPVFTTDAQGRVTSVTNTTITGFAPTTGGTGYIQNGTTAQTGANFFIQSAAANKVGGVIQGFASQTADLLELENSAGTVLTKVAASGDVTIASGTASTSTTTGALVVTGGAGLSGSLNAAGFGNFGTNVYVGKNITASNRVATSAFNGRARQIVSNSNTVVQLDSTDFFVYITYVSSGNKATNINLPNPSADYEGHIIIIRSARDNNDNVTINSFSGNQISLEGSNDDPSTGSHLTNTVAGVSDRGAIMFVLGHNNGGTLVWYEISGSVSASW